MRGVKEENEKERGKGKKRVERKTRISAQRIIVRIENGETRSAEKRKEVTWG